MSTAEEKILNNYLGLLKGLTTKMKLNLIEHLEDSTKKKVTEKSRLKEAFGGWHSNESAEELISTIRSNRNTNREIEDL